MANYKRLFLDGYSYYFTIVTYERNPILIENITLLRKSFRYAQSKFSFEINEIVVLPDHLHMILDAKYVEEYPKIISSIKRYFSKHCHPSFYTHMKQSHHREKNGYLPVWQKRYYEHTIRDEKDYHTKCQYIYNNPVKHGLVNNISQWKYSSLHARM